MSTSPLQDYRVPTVGAGFARVGHEVCQGTEEQAGERMVPDQEGLRKR